MIKVIAKSGFAMVLAAGLLFGAASAHAQDLSYDRYAAVYAKEPRAPSNLQKWLLHFPVYPFELIRWPMDRSLNLVEEYHLDTKTEWIYNQIKNRGISPKVKILSLKSLGAGVEIDFIRLAKKRHVLPDAILKGWIQRYGLSQFNTGGRVGMQRIADTGLSVVGHFEYDKRSLEHFYGIGPNTSRGEGFVYGLETTKVQAEAGYEWNPSWQLDTFMNYRNVNTNGGKDGGRGQIGDGIFSAPTVAGIDGDSLIGIGVMLEYDTRNQGQNSTKGGRRNIELSYHEGLNSSEARYLKYGAEVSHYLNLWSERRVLAFHFLGEHNDELNGGEVPFHQMPKLGGYGLSPHLSHTLRGFDDNRFTDESALLFNLEYRYTIWEYRYYKVDAVIFADEGQVFDEFSRFQWKDFRESYGVGLRLNAANVSLLSIELAHGDEGTNVYVKSQMPF